MRNLPDPNIPSILERNFPVSLRTEIEVLPTGAQQDFLRQYGREMKVIGLGYLTHFLGGASYLYQGKVFKQILFWLTGFGFGIGWIINLFRMPDMIQKENRKIARRIIRELSLKYGMQPAKPKDALDYILRQTPNQPKPRSVRPEYDPTNLTVEDLQAGFLVDYRLKTWEVVNESQYDWYNGESDRLLVLGADIERVFVYLRRENGLPIVYDMRQINIYALDRNMASEISMRGKPSNVINFQGYDFYRETEREGLCFFISEGGANKKVRLWEYVDLTRTKLLRVEQFDKADFRAYTGSIVSPLEFSEILPKRVMS
jgi:Domain of unknown function (DUF4178)